MTADRRFEAGQRLRDIAAGRLSACRAAKVSLHDVSVSFAPDRSAAVVSGLELTILPGEFVTFLGPSGCGKTTLLNVIGGMILPTTGKVRINDALVTAPTPMCNIVFQQHSLFEWMRVADNVAFGPRALGHPDPRGEAMRFLHLVGLEEHADAYPVTLSGGMRQRVAIARALATSPSVLLMDEPFGALDAQTRSIMQEELLKLRRSIAPTVIFVTHDVDEALLLSDRIFVMRAMPGGLKEEIAADGMFRHKEKVLRNGKYRALRQHILTQIREETLKVFNRPNRMQR
ncbi:MAG: ABC transporter ATP-binding protein [Zoogloeaceae bacterium]|nr:ABC transporter ATP-binding protein [Zoogloeaceae bacterium]